jgi:hypothetical protein
MSPRKQAAEVTPEGLEQELAALTIERERLDGERLFSETAVGNVQAMQDRARRDLEEYFPPAVFIDPLAPEALIAPASVGGPAMVGLCVLASDWWAQQQFDRIAGGPRPGYPSVQWSPLTKAQVADRIAVIDARLGVLELELRKAAALQRRAEADAEIAAIESGVTTPVDEPAADEPVPVVIPAVSPVVDIEDEDDDLGAKGPPRVSS